jgi:hypothetical protein
VNEAPHEEVEADAEADAEAEADVGSDDAVPVTLSADQRRHYLRATTLIPELGGEASAIAGASVGPIDRARSLFDHLTGGLYRFTDSELLRGADALRAGREGSAGDVACLFVAWARSLGIPARPVFGAWPNLLEQQHVWAEFHVDGLGWVPVDPAVAARLRRGDDAFESFGVGEDPDAHFGGLLGERVVFVRDAPIELPARLPTVGADLDETAVPRPDLIVMHEPDVPTPEASWEIWFSGWRAPLNAAYFTGLVVLVGLFVYQGAMRFFRLEPPGFVLPVLVGLGVFTVGAAVVLRRSLSIELTLTLVVLGGLAIGFAESLRAVPVLGPVVTFLFLR